MGWSDSEKDHLWQVVADPVVVAMYARNPGRVLDTDADGSVVQRARGRPSGVKGSVLKDIVAYALPGYLKKFSDPLAGESHTEFVEREKARRRHSLKTKRMVEETEADRLLRLEPVKLNQRLYTFFQNASPNKVAQRKPGRLTMPPAQQPLDRPLTPYEVFKSSGVVSAPTTSSASASSDRFRIADWNVAVKTHFNNLSAEEMAALEETTRERNEGHHADLPPALLKLTREKKVDDLPKMIRAAWDHWTGETDFRAITIYGGVGKDDEVETNILHNIEDSEGRSFVQFFCERLNLPTERFRLVLEMFFQNVYKPIAYPDERTSEQPEGVEGASEGNLEVDIDMALPMSDVRSEANTAVPQLSTEDDMDDIRSELSYLDVSELAQVTKGAETVHAMSGVRSEAHVAEPQFSADGDMDDTRSELSYVDISELTRLTMDVEAVHGIADDRPDMDVESEDPMSLVVDPVDASAHSAQATVEAVPISSGLEAGGADSNLEGPAPGVPEGSSVVQRAREIAAEFGANLAVIAQAALTEDWALLESITPHSSEEVATQAIVPPGNTERKMGSKRVSQPRKARVASRRAQPPNASTNASPVRKPLRSKGTGKNERNAPQSALMAAIPNLDGAMVRRSGRAAKPRQAGTWDYDDAVLRQAKASRK